MSGRRKTDPAVGRLALAAWRDGSAARAQLASAVRFTLEELALVTPGHAVEVRVAPFGAVQCVEGPKHTRGTPPNVVEMDAQTWLELATGQLDWAAALASARISASGERADISTWLPLAAARDRAGA